MAEQRPYYRPRDRINSREAGRTRPAQQMSENRFGLVVRRVRDRDARCPPLVNDALEKCVAETPGCVLEIPFVARGRRRNIRAFEDEFGAALTRQLRDKLPVGFRFGAAQAVVEMNYE